IAADFARLPELLDQTSGRSETPTTIRRSIPFESDGRRSPQMLRRPGDPRFTRAKLLIPIAVAALPAGYLFFGDPDPPVNGAVAPQVATNRLSREFSPVQEAEAPLSKAADATIESPIAPKVQTAPFQPRVLLDIKPTDDGTEAKPPPQKEG